jgi:hypothetical protein
MDTSRQIPLFSVSHRCQSSLYCGLDLDLYLEWMSYNIEIKEYFSERVIALKTAAEIFYELGNTGMAVLRMTVGQTLAKVTMPSHLDPTKSVAGIIDDSRAIELMGLRHPDPQLVAKINLQDNSLQVHGSWQKVKLTKSGGIPSRMGFASFVHKSNILGRHLYNQG